ncbi:MAG: nitroreductase family protein [Vulcanimicrobiota bacterium]
MSFIAYEDYLAYPPDEMGRKATEYYQLVRRRRTVREFDPRPVPRQVIEQCLLAAGTAPNGANHQPWHFAVVTDPDLKKTIRRAAEKEEQAFYHGRAPQEWLEALAPLGTDEHKPFLEVAPVLIAIFAESYSQQEDEKVKNYYVSESVGIATGILITALHVSGLCCLTHTPSPMGFLNQILDRPKNERPFLLLVVGYPAEGVKVPDISKKNLSEISSFHGRWP